MLQENYIKIKNELSYKQDIYLKYFVVVLTVFFTAKPLPLFNIDFAEISSFIFLFLFILIAIAKRIAISRNFIWATVILLVVNLISIIKYHEIYPRFFLIYWFALFNAFIVIKLVGKDMFRIFDNLLYYWSLYIIMPLYFVSQFIPEILINILMSLPFSHNNNFVYTERIYSFLFCYMPDSSFRNAGFGWEPGIFASVISIGMLSNLIRNQFKLNFRFWFFIIEIITTSSTTGFVILGVLFIWIYLNRYLISRHSIVIFPILIGILFLIISSPVINDKFEYSLKEANNVNLLLKEANKDKDSQVHPQRIASLVIASKDFQENPLFGSLGNFEDRWYFKKYGKLDNFIVVSGIGNYITIFGLMGIFIFLYFMSKSIKLLEMEYNIKSGYVIMILILSVSFSYYIFNSSLFYCLIFYSIFRIDFSQKVFNKIIKENA
jgi:hypothetical protein